MYTFKADPSHGWLGVSLKELIELGVERSITNFSYFDPSTGTAWLEEDCDVATFLMAKVGKDREAIQQWFQQNIKEVNTNGMSKIRSLPSYSQVITMLDKA